MDWNWNQGSWCHLFHHSITISLYPYTDFSTSAKNRNLCQSLFSDFCISIQVPLKVLYNARLMEKLSTIARTKSQCWDSGCGYCNRQMTNSAYNTLTVACQIPWHVAEGVRWNLSVSWTDKKLGKATPAISNSMCEFPAEKSLYLQVPHTESARVDAVSKLLGLVR